jgi:hypothetical protein
MASRIAGVGLGALLVLLACSKTETKFIEEPIPDDGDAGFDSRPDPDSGLGELVFRPETLYSGFDGTHTFTVPVAVYDSGDDLQVTASKPASVQITPKKLVNAARDDGTTDNGKYFFVTVKEAGTVTLTARSRGKTAQASLTVTAYPADRWTTGETRYKNGGTNGSGQAEPPCQQCHAGGSAIDHSPAALASVTDEKIGVVITTGISTAGFPIKIGDAPGHQWDVKEPVRDGLITYLRALAPRGFE